VSLKAFHVFFVVASTLLALFCGVWGVMTYAKTGGGGSLALGIGGFVAAAALVLYGIWFLRKLKNVSAP
jgi:hypothetical protein